MSAEHPDDKLTEIPKYLPGDREKEIKALLVCCLTGLGPKNTAQPESTTQPESARKRLMPSRSENIADDEERLINPDFLKAFADSFLAMSLRERDRFLQTGLHELINSVFEKHFAGGAPGETPVERKSRIEIMANNLRHNLTLYLAQSLNAYYNVGREAGQEAGNWSANGAGSHPPLDSDAAMRASAIASTRASALAKIG